MSRFYELLGLKPGASVAEVKAAYRDMAKVWHPDRFGHDERLREKAHEKLKGINEAYEILISGKIPRSGPDSATYESKPVNTRPDAKPLKWQWAVVLLVIFVAVFFAVSQLRKPDASISHATEQQTLEPQKKILAGQVATESRNKKPAEAAAARDVHQEAPTTSGPIHSMATVTVLIDPATGLLAKTECPTKTRMTYAAGSEPHGYCTAHQKIESADSRVKTIAKRVVTPMEWIRNGQKKPEGDRQ